MFFHSLSRTAVEPSSFPEVTSGSLQIFLMLLRGLEYRRDGGPLEQSEHCEGRLGHFEALAWYRVLGKSRVSI